MKKIKSLLLISMIGIFALSGCYSYVDPGYEAVEVYVSGGKIGNQELKPAGRYFHTWRVKYYDFPKFEQTAEFRGDDAFEFTVEGLEVGMEIGFSYIFTDVENIFRRYRVGVKEITNVHLKNIIRDALNSETRIMKMNGIYGERANDMMDRVLESVNAHVQPIGINVTGIFMIGRPIFPPQVEAAIQSRINATQAAEQREIEKREAIAQAAIDRERARGEADARLIRAESRAEANRLVAASLTPMLVQYEALNKWEGVLPKFTGNGAIPFIDIDN